MPALDQLDRACSILAHELEQAWAAEADGRGITLPATVKLRCKWQTANGLGPAIEEADRIGQSDAFGLRPLDDVGVQDLYDFFVALPSRRLVIAGGPGTGKTAAAILFMLRALAVRRQSGQTGLSPFVPVLLTAAGWQPDKDTLAEWAAKRIYREHPYLRSRGFGRQVVETLIAEGRICIIVDGLDEVAEMDRTHVIRRSSAARGVPLIVTSRPQEYRQATHEGHLRGAATMSMAPVTFHAAAEYLQSGLDHEAREQWRLVMNRIAENPKSGLAKALESPLMLNLARATFPPTSDPEALVQFSADKDRNEVEEFLLRRLVVQAYRSRTSLLHGANWLGRLAHELEDRREREFAWWHLGQRTVVQRSEALRAWLSLSSIVAAAAALIIWAVIHGGAVASFTAGSSILAVALLSASGHPQQLFLRPTRDSPFGTRTMALAAAIGCAPILAHVVSMASLTVGTPAWVLALSVAVIVGFSAPEFTARSRASQPSKMFALDSISVLPLALAFGVSFGATFDFGTGFVVAAVFMMIYATSCSEGLYSIIAGVFQRALRRGPVLIVASLAAARDAHLLRQAGDRYQFRHAQLQLLLGREGENYELWSGLWEEFSDLH